MNSSQNEGLVVAPSDATAGLGWFYSLFLSLTTNRGSVTQNQQETSSVATCEAVQDRTEVSPVSSVRKLILRMICGFVTEQNTSALFRMPGKYQNE